MRNSKGQFMKGYSNPWNRGLKMPDGFSDKISETLKLQWASGKRKLPKGLTNKGNIHSEETRKIMSENRMGKALKENNPNWNGGTSRGYKTGYYSTEYKNWRKAVFERDDYACQECGWRGYITAHHIKSFAHYPELRYDINNGKTLCEHCHSLTDNYKGRNKKRNLILL